MNLCEPLCGRKLVRIWLFEVGALQNTIQEFISYLKENKTTFHHYIDELVNAILGNKRCLHWQS
jgi:hypothetical protein